MSIVDTDREQVERIATLARLTLQAVRDALVKAELADHVEVTLSRREADTAHLQWNHPGMSMPPAVAIQNYDVPAGWLEAQNDFTVRFIPHD